MTAIYDFCVRSFQTRLNITHYKKKFKVFIFEIGNVGLMTIIAVTRPAHKLTLIDTHEYSKA